MSCVTLRYLSVWRRTQILPQEINAVRKLVYNYIDEENYITSESISKNTKLYNSNNSTPYTSFVAYKWDSG